MYNDCWPAVRSWTIVDYYLHKTPSFYAVQRAFSAIVPVIARENGKCMLYGVNDTPEAWKGTVRYGVFSAQGDYRSDQKQKALIPPNASVLLAEICDDSTCSGQNIAFACLEDAAGTLVSRTRYSPERYPVLGLEKADITISPSAAGFTFSSDCFVMGVCLGNNGDELYSDNMFDLFPNQPYTIQAPVRPQICFTLNDVLDQRNGRKG